MSKKPETERQETQETAAQTFTLVLTPALADHLAKLLNVAQYSGNAGELRQLLATHEQLVAAFNEAVAMPTKEGA